VNNTRSQKIAIKELMLDPKYDEWWTLHDIVHSLYCRNIMASEAGCSARLRELRKDGFIVERERVKPGSNLYQYRLLKG
jgi:hypothetical protein